MWYGNEKNAEDWDWQATTNGLQPIFSKNDTAPSCILEKISCACLKNYGPACGCRKQGLKCSLWRAKHATVFHALISKLKNMIWMKI